MLRGRILIVLAVFGVAGLLLLILADRLGQRVLIGPGLLLFAIGIFAAGLDAIWRRYTSERSDVTHGSQIFVGASAVLIGLSLCLGSVAIAIVGLAFVFGSEQELLNLVLDRPGAAFVALGGVFGVFGASRVLGARGWSRSVTSFLATVPERIGGLMLFFLGAVLVLVGMYELVAPDAFDRMLDFR